MKKDVLDDNKTTMTTRPLQEATTTTMTTTAEIVAAVVVGSGSDEAHMQQSVQSVQSGLLACLILLIRQYRCTKVRQECCLSLCKLAHRREGGPRARGSGRET